MSKVMSVFARLFSAAGALLKRIFIVLFGSWHWQMPVWLRWLITRATSFCQRARANPKRSAGFALIALLAIAAGIGGYRWYSLQPKPVQTHATLAAPTLTTWKDDKPIVAPLVIEFSDSAAPLEVIGKTITKGITLSPKLAGTWTWETETRLVFQPLGDWPVGQQFTVDLAKKDLVAAQVRLDNYQLEFASASFDAQITESRFYQDPRDPALKKLVATIRFSHSVDAADFEKRVQLQLAKDATFLGKSKDGIGADATGFAISYDKQRLNAYIHSHTLTLPREDTPMRLILAKGVRSSRGGDGTAAEIASTVTIPGRYSLGFNNFDMTLADNEKLEPEQVLLFESSAPVPDTALTGKVKAWLLPVYHPNEKIVEGQQRYPYHWYHERVDQAVLSQSEALPLQRVPGDDEQQLLHSYKFNAPVGRFVYLEVAPGVQATGGTSSAKASVFTLQIKPYPRSLKLLSQGALLKLDGDRKVGFVGRAIDGVKIEVGRLLPNQLHHLVDANYGAFVQPEVSGTLMDRLVERSTENRAIASSAPGKPVYDSIDLNTYLREQTHSKLGVFLVKLSGLKRNENPTAGTEPYDEYSYSDARDTRLILLTDLGLIEKHAIDGSRDVFVQSISTGAPVANARVDLIGRNGLALQSKMTAADGRAHFDNVDKFQREQTPLMVVAEREGDLSFLPLRRGDRSLNFSRFDIGGVNSAIDANALSAYLFSDRGIYRPGEDVHIGSIVRTQDWKAALDGIPVEAEVTDPRGLTILRKPLQLTRSSFQEINWSTQTSAPTGTYNVTLYLMKNGRRDVQLGSTTVRVQEFEPDRLKVRATLSTGEVAGWIAPEQVKAQVNAMNLFGTPAINRRVTGEMTLAPAIPDFAAYPDYAFFDRTKLKEQFEDKLPDATTDDDGNAVFNLNLERFDRATYRLSLLARAYEAEGGRNVAAFSAVLVSSAPYLVGVKTPQADLNYLQKDSAQRSRWLAVDPQLKNIALNDLKLEWVQRKYVSVLIKDYDGTYRYQSRLKETVRETKPTTLAEKGSDLTLPTAEPGDFALVLRDKDGAQLNRLEYSVVGQGNLSRSLERNAELQLKLDKREYTPGETIEISIQAPYTGAGLITIERDRVYQHIWFNATTTSSVQKIRLPDDFEGGGYINVQFVRAANSDEIFTSPLSYGVLPFAVSRAQRTEAVTVTAPTRVKPGAALTLQLSTAVPAQVVVFAVDEGILQVARYKKPEPLDFFFQKRQLEVGTAQILDLILPEFQQLLLAAAAGGDADALAGRHLNPFKNKHKPPVAYWSGVVDVGPEGKTLTYNVPDYFNGRLHIFAVAVTPGTIGVTEANSEVRGDLILSPNLPLMVAPGDEFDISVGVANNAKDANGPVTLQLKTSAELSVVGDSNQKLDIVSGKEGSAQYRLKATGKLGGATLTFVAGIGTAARTSSAKMEETLSVRPPVPFRTQLSAGRSDKRSLTLPLKREMYAEYRNVQATTAWSPLAWAEGLSAYLEHYPYYCTEQLVSQGMPALLFTHHPELGAIKGKATVADVIQMLRTRQNGEGAFGLWAASTLVHDWPSLYAVHFLIEAREHGEVVPNDMLDNANGWLQRIAGPRGNTLIDMRKRAYAIYLLTRQGIVATELLGTLQKEIDARYAKEWPNDLTAAYVASSYRLLQQRDFADKIIKRVPWAINSKLNAEDVYYDTLVHDAQLLYLLSKHFPQRLDSLSNAVLDNLGKQLSANTYNSLSAAYLLLAFESYSQAAQAQSGALALNSVDKAGKASVLNVSGELLKRAAIGIDARQLQFNKDSDLPSFYAVSESGFDAPSATPASEVRNGLEIARDYTDLKGNPLTTITVGEEFLVRLRVRAIDREQFASVAVVDLLPGGVEPVINRAPAATEDEVAPEENASAEYTEGNGDYSDNAAAKTTPAVLPLGESQSTWHPENADLRDDRLVLYGSLYRNAATFIYRVRATNSGKFQTPAPYAEGMYDRTQYAIGKAGSLEIVKP
ncbi:MAG: alpha-2-macroglobulin [Spongiibacteraceae bacterium]